MGDLTIIFLTCNKVPEKWAEYHKKVLLEAVGEAPIITMSMKPMDWGLNILQDGEPSASNIYRQMLRASKVAETPYVAIVEDDTLYPKEHFKYRPPLDKFGYNMSQWGVLAWQDNPVYFHRHRESNLALIASRELLIKCLEERFALVPDFFGEVGKERVDKKYGFKGYPIKKFYSVAPIISFRHKNSIDKMEQEERKSTDKSLIAYEVPYWGKANELVKKFQ